MKCERINKVLEGRPHIDDAIRNKQVHLVFNTTQGIKARSDSRSIREAALMNRVPYFTTATGAIAASEAIEVLIKEAIEVRPLQSYFM